MPETAAADLGLGNFNTATVANDTTMFDAFILSAGALVITGRAENTLAEKPIGLGLVRLIVDGLRILNFTMRPSPNLFRRGQRNPDALNFVHIADFVIPAAG